MPSLPSSHALSIFAIAAIATMMSCRASAGEQGLAENYLACFELDNPAVFFYEKYLQIFRFAEDYKQILNFRQKNPQKWTPERVEKQWNKKWQDEYHSKEFYSSVFQQSIITKGYMAKEHRDLIGLIRGRDHGQGIPCAVDGTGKCVENAASQRNIPFAVDDVGVDGEITLRETLSGMSGFFTESDWGKYFFMNGQWHDPAVRKIWVTSWEDLSGHWNKLLGEGNAKEVRRQIKAIVGNGRLESAGGGAWRSLIAGWWRANADKVAPKLKIYNNSGDMRTIRISWKTGAPRDPDKPLEYKASDESVAPFEGFLDSRKITVDIEYFIRECCGNVKTNIVFNGPFVNDQELILLKGANLWEKSPNTRIEVRVRNIDGRNIQVDFISEKQHYEMHPTLGEAGVWACDVPAHTKGKVEVYNVKANEKTSLGSLFIDKTRLHRGANVSEVMDLQPVVHLPELRRQKVIEIVKELNGEEMENNALLTVMIEGAHAIFDGDVSKYSNPQVLGKSTIHKSSEPEIPVKVLPPSKYNKDILELLEKSILEKHNLLEMKYTVRDRPAANAFISVPKQTFYIGNWDECKEILDGLPDGQRGKVLKALSDAKPSWDGLILKYVREKDLLPTVRIWNNTGERVDLALGGNNPVRVAKGGHYDLPITSTTLPVIHVRKTLSESDEPLLDIEYENNTISSKISKWPTEWGESIEYTITAKDIELKPAPVLLLSWPPDLTDVEVVAYGRHYRPTENRMTIELPRWEKLEDLTIISGNYEPYEPEISNNLRYFGLRYGQTNTPPIHADQLVKKSEPLPEPEQPGINPNKVKRLRRVLQDAVSSLDKSGNRETAEDNIREAMPGKNKTMKALMEDESNTDGGQVKAARSVLTNKLGVDADTVLRIWGWL